MRSTPPTSVKPSGMPPKTPIAPSIAANGTGVLDVVYALFFGVVTVGSGALLVVNWGNDPDTIVARAPIVQCGSPPRTPPWPSVVLPPAMAVPSCGAMYLKRSSAFWQASAVVPVH